MGRRRHAGQRTAFAPSRRAVAASGSVENSTKANLPLLSTRAIAASRSAASSEAAAAARSEKVPRLPEGRLEDAPPLLALRSSLTARESRPATSLAAAMPSELGRLNEQLDEMQKGFYENDDHGVDACPATIGDVPCACWLARHKYGGTMGPFQEVEL